MQKIDYYAVARSMYGLLRNKHISYRGHLLVEVRRKKVFNNGKQGA